VVNFEKALVDMDSHGRSGGEQAKIEAGGFEAAEVGIEGRNRETGANGESGEVGVHLDLGRGGWDGSQFEPKFASTLGFGIEGEDVELGVPSGKRCGGLNVGECGTRVVAADGGGCSETEE